MPQVLCREVPEGLDWQAECDGIRDESRQTDEQRCAVPPTHRRRCTMLPTRRSQPVEGAERSQSK